MVNCFRIVIFTLFWRLLWGSGQPHSYNEQACPYRRTPMDWVSYRWSNVSWCSPGNRNRGRRQAHSVLKTVTIKSNNKLKMFHYIEAWVTNFFLKLFNNIWRGFKQRQRAIWILFGKRKVMKQCLLVCCQRKTSKDLIYERYERCCFIIKYRIHSTNVRVYSKCVRRLIKF